MKIILDTNLLVAAMFNPRSAAARIVALVLEGKVDLLWHARLRDEACLITGRIQRAVPRVSIDLDRLFLDEHCVREMPDLRGISADPDDDKFIACAVAGQAELIVSNDRDLLDLDSYQNIPIVTPSQAWKMIENRMCGDC